MKHLLIGLMVAFAATGMAQIEDYNYQDYRQASTRLKQLDLSFAFAGEHAENRAALQLAYGSISQMSLAGSLTYREWVNKPELQRTIFTSFATSPGFSIVDNLGIKQEVVAADGDLRFNMIQDNYRNYDQWFIGWNLNLSSGVLFRDTELTGQATEDTEETIVSFSLLPKLRIGMGRHEQITNAWHAYRILQRFNFLGMTSDQSFEAINQMGQFIDELRAMRVFDSRLTYIAHLQLLDDYLQNEVGMDQAQTIKYFAELNDMWRFGISESRFKGKKMTFEIGPEVDLFHITTVDFGDESEDTFGNLGVQAEANYTVGKPLNALMQFNWEVGARIRYYKYKSDNGSIERNYDVTELRPYVGAFFGYFPTTRTEYNLSAEVYYLHREADLNAFLILGDEMAIGGDISGQMRYWFSPTTSLTADIRYLHGPQVIINNLAGAWDAQRLTYGIRLNHAFF